MAPKVFLPRFNPEATYTVNKSNFICSGVEFAIGDIFDKSLVNVRRLRMLYEARKIVVAEEHKVSDEKDLTNTNDSVIMPEIVKAGPAWKKVVLNGEQIGKSVKTEEEAQAIIDEWLENQTKP